MGASVFFKMYEMRLNSLFLLVPNLRCAYLLVFSIVSYFFGVCYTVTNYIDFCLFLWWFAFRVGAGGASDLALTTARLQFGSLNITTPSTLGRWLADTPQIAHPVATLFF
jgi:hypothetical protein